MTSPRPLTPMLRLALLLPVLLASAQAQTIPANALSYSRVSSFTYYTTADAGVGNKVGLLKTETVEPLQADLCVNTTYNYDNFGNKVSATTANCANASAGAQFTSRTSSSNFGTDGRFAVGSTNAALQTETRSFDARFGALATLVGSNKLAPTTITVDISGRKTRELRPDGTSTVTASKCPSRPM